MKNETTRTKTQTGFSSRAIALVLCFVMLLTAIGSGSVLSAIAVAAEGSGAAELVDAAKAGADVNAPAPGEAEESSDVLEPEDIDDGFVLTKKGADIAGTGADADLTKTGDTTTYYVCYNLNNSSAPNNLTSSNQMKSIGDFYWGEIPSNGTQFFFGISDSSTFVGHSQLGSGRNATMDSNGVINQVGNQPYTYSGTDYYYCYGHTTSAATVYVRWDGSTAVYLTTSKPAGYDDGGGGGETEAGTSSSTVTIADVSNLTQVYYDFSATNAGAGNMYTTDALCYDPDVGNGIRLGFLPSGVATNWIIAKTSQGNWDNINYSDRSTNNKFNIASGGDSATGWSSYTDFAWAPLSVIKGEKVMFYIETYPDNYGTSVEGKTIGVTSNSTSSYKSAHRLAKGVGYLIMSTSDRSTYKYITNRAGEWNGELNSGITNAAGGELFVKGGSSNVSAITGLTTVANSIPQGTSTLEASTTCGSTHTAVGSNLSVQYYIVDQSDSTNIQKAGVTYTASTSAKTVSLDLSSLTLPVGSYYLKTVLTDGGVYYVSDTDSFDVITPTYYDVTVKSNNARLGTGTASPASAYAGQTVTITISENMGSFESISVKDASNNTVATTTVTANTTYTFPMPSSNATVNLTFTDYSAASNFYYNSYETNGNESSSRYAAQMTEGKLNGSTFSYYHVDGRTGTDQLFTVSYKNPAHSSTVYFRTPESWKDKHGWNSGIQAQFFSTDSVQLKDWAWMTFDKDYGNGDKVYRITVPYGARYVQFRGTANDPDTSNYPYTMLCDLNWTSDNNDCFYITTYGKNSAGNFDQIGECNIGNQSKLIPDNFYENFNGEGKYTNNWSTNGFSNHNASHTGSHSYTKPSNLGTNSGDYYILVLYSGQSYTINGVTRTADHDPEIIWLPELPGTEDIDTSEVNVFAKDSSVVIDWNNKGSAGASNTSGTAYGFGVIADTKLYDSDGTTAIGTAHTHNGNDYESAKVVVSSEDSTDIVVKTTISSTYTSKYYLKGWCVNGKTYACGTNVEGVNAESAGEASGSDKVYTMTYTVPAGTEKNAKIEITPIYYLLSTYKSTNSITTVTFYLEGYNTISSKWGDTPYIYPFYGNLNNVDNSYGVYPGQPMVYADGQYSIEVPVNKNVPIAKSPGSTAVKGITINNGYADHVHRNLVYKWTDHDNDADHKQTYDYDDFYKIYEECLKNGSEHPNAIFFRIQDEDTVYNRSQYGGGKSGQFASGTNNITISDISSSGNGWELLVNRYNQPVNIFGSSTGITAPDANVDPEDDTENALYVVSTGYNANIAGDYGTMWKIYNGSGQLISSGGGRVGVPPSVLLLRGNSSGYASEVDALNYPSADRSVDGVGSYKDSVDDYETIYKALQDAAYTGKRVYITYEKDAQDTRKVTSGTGAFRLDGRWYYTHKSDNVSSTMSIQFWDDSTGAWVDDSGQSGSATLGSCDANFTDTGASGKTSGTHTIQNSENFTFTATPGAGWQFDSWQIKYSDTSYDQISTTASSSMPATASYHIVARFVKTSAGDLTITHTLNSNSTGEGTVDMAVNVYTDSSMTTLVTGFTEKTGTRVYLDSTYINNSTAANYYIKVQLKATPQYDGKVTAFGYDSFNSSKSIIATTDPADLADAAENTLTTSTFSFPVSDLYNVSTQKTDTLNYTSLIADTPHYYNFVYNLTTRGNVGKTYTSKGVLNMTEYKKVYNESTHTLNDSILVAKAPFESNFLKSNTLDKGTITWDAGTHTYSATSEFKQADSIPDYHVTFELPYDYITTGNSSANPPTKKYTVTAEKTYVENPTTFSLLAKYNTFVTVDATATTVGSQENVDKVTDGSDINHAGNNFITAPEELDDSGTPMYFKYWDVKKLKADGSAGDDVAKIYYPDFHYRVYSDYYVEAVYSNVAADSWKHNYSEDDNKDVNCSVLYLGDSRNQWNDGSQADGYTSNDAAVAADLIYSDFIFHYSYMGQEIKDSTDTIEVGMILERATYIDTTDNDTQKWLTGSSSVNDMSYYRANYGGTGDKSTETARKTAILTALNASSALPSGTIKTAWDKSELNNKNFTEQSYKAYSQYGQTVANNTITFSKDNVIDNYVYRAYAYIKDTNGYTLSDPVYFSMRYTSNLKYAE